MAEMTPLKIPYSRRRVKGSANAAYFLPKGVLGAPASRWQQLWNNRVFGHQLYVNNDNGVSVFGWAGETPNVIYFFSRGAATRK